MVMFCEDAVFEQGVLRQGQQYRDQEAIEPAMENLASIAVPRPIWPGIVRMHYAPGDNRDTISNTRWAFPFIGGRGGGRTGSRTGTSVASA